jgi:hypothetical protein
MRALSQASVMKGNKTFGLAAIKQGCKESFKMVAVSHFCDIRVAKLVSGGVILTKTRP